LIFEDGRHNVERIIQFVQSHMQKDTHVTNINP